MPHPVRAFLITCLCLAAAGWLAGQQSPTSSLPQAGTIIQSTRGEVLFDMVATDKHGRIITDLKPDEVQVLDNGIPQKIVSFERVSQSVHLTRADLLAAGIPPSSVQQAALPTFNLISIVFGSMDTGSRALARSAATSYIKNDLGPDDYVAVYDINTNLFALQTYTRDRTLLLQAVNAATGGSSSVFRSMNDAVEKQVTQAITEAQNAPTVSGGPGAGASAGAAMMKMAGIKMDQMVADAMTAAANADTTDFGRMVITSLMGIVQGQQRLPGRKSLLYFTQNMPVNSSTAYLFHELLNAANRASVSFYMIDPTGLNLESDNAQSASMLNQAAAVSRTEQNLGKAVTFAQANNSNLTEDIQYSSRHMMQSLAKSTGGFYVANTNDLQPQMQRLASDISEHYEISYVPTSGDDGKFHRIEIKLTRPHLLVRARTGYYALPPMKEPVMAYEAPIFAVLHQSPAPNDFPLTQTQLIFPTSATAQTIDVAMQFPLDKFKFVPVKTPNGDRVSTHFTAMYLVEDMQGDIVHKESHDFDLNMQPAMETRPMIFERKFTLPAGNYHLQSVIFEPESKKATVQTSVLSVPAVQSGSMRISSIAIVGSTEKGAQAGDPLAYNGVKIVPDINQPLKKAVVKKVGFFFRAYAPKGVDPQLIIAFVKDGKLVGKAAEKLPPPGTDGSVPVLAGFPMSNFQPGQYQVDVVLMAGTDHTVQTAQFTVE